MRMHCKPKNGGSFNHWITPCALRMGLLISICVSGFFLAGYSMAAGTPDVMGEAAPGPPVVRTPQEIPARSAMPPSTKSGQMPPPMFRQGMQPNLGNPPQQTGLPMIPPAATRKGSVILNFDDADVYTIIQTVFGDVLKANYVVDPRIKGRVTFRSVAPVSVGNVLPIMEVIFRLNGIGIIEEHGLYRMIPISDISKEPSPVNFGRDSSKIITTGKALLQVIPVLYIQSSEAIKLITPFVTANAVIIDVPKSNQIIVADTDANVKRIVQLVEMFDNEKVKQKTPQIYVYAIQNSKAKDIANLLQQIFLGGKSSTDKYSAKNVTAQPATSIASAGATIEPYTQSSVSLPSGGEVLVSDITRIIPDEITNTITILSTPEDYILIKGTIEKIDIPPRQVVIEGMIASVALKDNLSVGIAALFKASSAKYNANIALNPVSLNVDPANLSQSGFPGAPRGPIPAPMYVVSTGMKRSPAVPMPRWFSNLMRTGFPFPAIPASLVGS